MLNYVLYKEPEMVANWSESPVIKSLGKSPFKSPLCIRSRTIPLTEGELNGPPPYPAYSMAHGSLKWMQMINLVNSGILTGNLLFSKTLYALIFHFYAGE